MTYIKCLILAPIGLAFTLLAWILSPFLPLFSALQLGACDNGSIPQRLEPRLPLWLAWFQTPDNSLWGDAGWRTVHCPHYKSYLGMVKWLFRNPGYGFAWSVLAAQPPAGQFITAIGDMTVNDGVHGNAGWYLSRTDGAFRFRWIVKIIPGRCFMLDVGWCMPVSGITDGSKLLFYGINPRFPKFGTEVLK